jgi:hypothetical protein
MEHPILFSGEMVRAIMEGRKTQTRRVIWPKSLMIPYRNSMEKIQLRTTKDHYLFDFRYEDGTISTIYGIRPKYHIGDLLWVRETWMPFTENGVCSGMAIYKATDKPEPDGDRPLKWRPSIFMPRWASRITLEVVSVRVERVQDISEEDALSEGISETSFWKPKEMDNRPFEEKWWDDYYFWTNYPQVAFQNLWDSINAKRGYGWDANPWVWVIEFRRVE